MFVILSSVNSIKYVIIYFKIQGFKKANHFRVKANLFKKCLPQKYFCSFAQFALPLILLNYLFKIEYNVSKILIYYM